MIPERTNRSSYSLKFLAEYLVESGWAAQERLNRLIQLPCVVQPKLRIFFHQNSAFQTH
jgi:hypothetical protein